MLKIFKSSGGTLTDLSKDVNDYHSSATTVSIVAATDKLYIGSRFPFNSKYFKISSAASPSVNLTFKYLSGNGFVDHSDVEDGTENFSKSGTVRMVPDRDYGVLREDTENIDELNTVKIYGRFWYEISFDVDTSFDLNWVGQVFNNDDQLGSKYPDLNRSSVKTAFASGKTDWEEQAMMAAEEISKDLVDRQTILDVSQILEDSELKLASIEKCAELIYRGLGQDFVEQAEMARDNYDRLISKPPRFVDSDGNARVTKSEFAPRIGYLHR